MDARYGNLRDKALSNDVEVWAERRYAGKCSRVNLVGIEVVNKSLRQEHVTACDTNKGLPCSRAWSYLREDQERFS